MSSSLRNRRGAASRPRHRRQTRRTGASARRERAPPPRRLHDRVRAAATRALLEALGLKAAGSNASIARYVRRPTRRPAPSGLLRRPRAGRRRGRSRRWRADGRCRGPPAAVEGLGVVGCRLGLCWKARQLLLALAFGGLVVGLRTAGRVGSTVGFARHGGGPRRLSLLPFRGLRRGPERDRRHCAIVVAVVGGGTFALVGPAKAPPQSTLTPGCPLFFRCGFVEAATPCRDGLNASVARTGRRELDVDHRAARRLALTMPMACRALGRFCDGLAQRPLGVGRS